MLFAVVLAAAIHVLPPVVRGDFDSDGKMDAAEILKNESGAYQLVVRRGARPSADIVVQTFKSLDSDLFLDTAKAGTQRTWCGKGGGDDKAPCPRNSVELKGGELVFGSREGSASVVIWTGERFEVVVMSD